MLQSYNSVLSRLEIILKYKNVTKSQEGDSRNISFLNKHIWKRKLDLGEDIKSVTGLSVNDLRCRNLSCPIPLIGLVA